MPVEHAIVPVEHAMNIVLVKSLGTSNGITRVAVCGVEPVAVMVPGLLAGVGGPLLLQYAKMPQTTSSTINSKVQERVTIRKQGCVLPVSVLPNNSQKVDANILRKTAVLQRYVTVAAVGKHASVYMLETSLSKVFS